MLPRTNFRGRVKKYPRRSCSYLTRNDWGYPRRPTVGFRRGSGQAHGSGVSVLSESRDSVIGGVRVRLGVDVGSLGCFFGGLRVAVIEGVGGYEVSGLFQARQRHVALLLDPIIMLLG